MIRAVDQRHRDVDDAESRAARSCSASRTPASTDEMYWRGTAPPCTFSSNTKPAPRGSGSTSSTTSPNWPWPPDLLLVPAAHRDLVADRLAIGRPRTACAFDRDAEAGGEALQRDAQMHLALAGELHLAAFLVLRRRPATGPPPSASPSRRRAAPRPCGPWSRRRERMDRLGRRDATAIAAAAAPCRVAEASRRWRCRRAGRSASRLAFLAPRLLATRPSRSAATAPAMRVLAAARADDGRRRRGTRRAARAPARACRHGRCGWCVMTCAERRARRRRRRGARASCATPGASWRSAFSRRVTPLPRSAEPISTGTTMAVAQFAARDRRTPGRAAARCRRSAPPSARRRNRRAAPASR